MAENLKIIDIVKLFCAIGVVAIHTELASAFKPNLMVALFDTIYHTLPVPFFFMTSGYLLFRKVELPLNYNGKIRIRKYLVKIMRLYVVWTILFLPFTVWGMQNETSIVIAVLKFFRGVFLVGENLYSWPLWYLLGLICATFILYVCLSLHISLKKIFCFSILLTILGFLISYMHKEQLCTSIVNAYYLLFVTTRNGVFVGLIYVVLGMLSFYWKSLNIFYLLGMLVCGGIGCLYSISFSEFFFIYAFFNLVIKCNLNFISDVVAVNCRRMSTIIYFTHMWWVVFWGMLLPQTTLYPLYLFMLSCFSSYMLGVMLLKYMNRKFFDICFQ